LAFRRPQEAPTLLSSEVNLQPGSADKCAGTHVAPQSFGTAAGIAALEDTMEKLVEICFEIVIVALICVSPFSGQPAFNTTQAAASPAPIAFMAP
jgi:hypothetical protein